MEAPLVYIVLLNYNGYKDTIECVKSLDNIDYPNFKTVIVDNDSSDGSEEILIKELEGVIIIQSHRNAGFAGGNNIGIKYALENKAEYVLLLNNDTLVEPDFLRIMLESFKASDKIGMVGCKIMYHPEKDTIWYGGGSINWLKSTGVHEGQREKDIGQCDTEKEITFMTGCAMLIKSQVFKDCGMLPEEYFMYIEDLDYCAKLQTSGYSIRYNPRAKIYHKVSAATGGEESAFSVRWGTRNRLIFMHKYKECHSTISYNNAKLFYYVSRAIKYIKYIIDGDSNKAKVLKQGLKEGRTYLKGLKKI